MKKIKEMILSLFEIIKKTVQNIKKNILQVLADILADKNNRRNILKELELIGTKSKYGINNEFAVEIIRTIAKSPSNTINLNKLNEALIFLFLQDTKDTKNLRICEQKKKKCDCDCCSYIDISDLINYIKESADLQNYCEICRKIKSDHY